jgi:hypothetical protein
MDSVPPTVRGGPVEVAGIAAVAARLGKTPAERLLILLLSCCARSRECDLFGRSFSWRIQGILPEQEPRVVPAIPIEFERDSSVARVRGCR